MYEVVSMVKLRWFLAACLSLVICLSFGLAEEISSQDAFRVLEQTTLIRSEQSPTGYFVTFRYKDASARRVRIRGEWSFSTARGSTPYTCVSYDPQDYQQGMFPLQIAQDDWPAYEMELDEASGVWSYTIPLPSGVWSYRFIVNGQEGAALTDYTDAVILTDPNNPPVERAPGQQTNSQIYVPFDPERQDQDFSIQAARTDGKTGTLDMLYYDASGLTYSLLDEPSVAVYLPYGYDPQRAEPYKVLYAAHGSGIESETSWWNKGVIGNITDNLIADYGLEPMVIVLLNNYADSFDYHNLLERIVPLIEQTYHVRTDADGKAICGISKGAIMAKNVLLEAPDAFRYYGLFSGCYFSESNEQFDGEALRDCHIYLASGERESGLHALCRTAEKLANVGKTDLSQYTVMGGHNWYTWRQIYVDFAMNELWK